MGERPHEKPKVEPATPRAAEPVTRKAEPTAPRKAESAPRKAESAPRKAEAAPRKAEPVASRAPEPAARKAEPAAPRTGEPAALKKAEPPRPPAPKVEPGPPRSGEPPAPRKAEPKAATPAASKRTEPAAPKSAEPPAVRKPEPVRAAEPAAAKRVEPGKATESATAERVEPTKATESAAAARVEPTKATEPPVPKGGEPPTPRPPEPSRPRPEPLTRQERDRFRDGARHLGEPATRAAERALARDDVPPGTMNQAVRDFNGLRDSGRLAGGPERTRGVLDSALAKLGGKDPRDAEGRAAELRAAHETVRNGDLAPGTGIAMNVTDDRPVDLGNGTVVDVGPASEGDLAYQTRDGAVHLDEVKKSAGALADKMRDHPEQLNNMLAWRAADPENRRIGCRIDSDRDWHRLFNRVDGDQRAIERLAGNDVPVRIAGRDLSPEQLRTLNRATQRAAADRAHRMERGKMSEWFDEHVPTLDRAREFLRPYGVDFL